MNRVEHWYEKSRVIYNSEVRYWNNRFGREQKCGLKKRKADEDTVSFMERRRADHRTVDMISSLSLEKCRSWCGVKRKICPGYIHLIDYHFDNVIPMTINVLPDDEEGGYGGGRTWSKRRVVLLISDNFTTLFEKSYCPCYFPQNTMNCCIMSRKETARELFSREIGAYRQLIKLQGTIIPQFYCAILTNQNNDCRTGGIILEYLSNEVFFTLGEWLYGDKFREVGKTKTQYPIVRGTDPVSIVRKRCLQAIELIHDNGVLHNDISLENLLVNVNNLYVVVVDFANSTLIKDIYENDSDQIDKLKANELTATSRLFTQGEYIEYTLKKSLD